MSHDADLWLRLKDAVAGASDGFKTVEAAADYITNVVYEVVEVEVRKAYQRGVADERDEARKQADEIRRERAEEWYR